MKTLGQVAYEAYSKRVGHIDVRGETLPHWDKLSVGVMTGWQAAADAVVEKVNDERPPERRDGGTQTV